MGAHVRERLLDLAGCRLPLDGSWITAPGGWQVESVDESYDDAGRAATHTVLPRRLADGG
jgi:hypothetical protein